MANGHGGKRPGAGRKLGQVNESTRIAKEAIELVFERLGGVDDFHQWAAANRDEFYRLLFPKLLPVQMQHSGANGGAIETLQRIESVIVDPQGSGSTGV